MSDSRQPYGLYPTRLLHPWDSPGKRTGAGCHFLLQGIFPSQGWSPHSRISCTGWQILHQCATWEPRPPPHHLEALPDGEWLPCNKSNIETHPGNAGKKLARLSAEAQQLLRSLIFCLCSDGECGRGAHLPGRMRLHLYILCAV